MKKSREFAIGDVHGCFLTLERLLFKVIDVKKSDRLYFVGDYIDRGPRSKEVIELIQSMRKDGYKIRTVIGNHEEMFKKAIDYTGNIHEIYYESWFPNGGRVTVKSFTKDGEFTFKKKHRDFFRSLEEYIALEDFIICHAGINCTLPDPFSDREHMLWSKISKVIPEKIGFRKVISGHVPKSLNEIHDSLSTNHIQIDGGCVYYKTKPNMGYLVAIELHTLEMYSQQCIDLDENYLIIEK